MLEFLMSRLSEKSTWTAIIGIAGSAGLWHMSTNATEQAVSAAVAVVLAIQALMKENGSAK